jgi:hypothetical protein
MDAGRRDWLTRLVESIERTMGEVRHLDDPHHRALVHDLERLRANIESELGSYIDRGRQA